MERKVELTRKALELRGCKLGERLGWEEGKKGVEGEE